MAIALDTSSKGTDATSTGQSWSHTCTGSDRLLVVGVSHTDAADGTLTGITYNGVAMTKAASIRRADNVCWTQLWYLVAPASGANTIQITLSGSTRHSATASSYTGVKQTGQPDASTTSAVSGNQVCTVTTTADNSWGVIVGQSGAASAGTNVTQRQLEASFGQFHGDSNGPKTPAGSFSMTMNASGDSAGVMATFAPAVTAAVLAASVTIAVTVAAALSLTATLAAAPSIAVTTSANLTAYPLMRGSATMTLASAAALTPGYGGTRLHITVNGTARGFGHAAGAFILHDSLRITDSVDHTPTTASFTCKGFTPVVGQRVVMAFSDIDNPRRLFAGTIMSLTARYVGTPGNLWYDVHCIDETWGLNKTKVTKRYVGQTASSIVTDLLTTYAPTYTAVGVVAGLDVIDEITFTFQDLTDCISQVTKRIGGYWYCDYFKDVHCYVAPEAVNPIALTSAHSTLEAFSVTRDMSQMITRAIVEGMGSTSLATVDPAAITIALVDTSPFSATGGWFICGPQLVSYTGIAAGASVAQGGATTVGGGTTTAYGGNGASSAGGGLSTCVGGAAANSTSIIVADVTQFFSGGGFFYVPSTLNQPSYTGVTVTGPGNQGTLDGIPASGSNYLFNAVAAGATIYMTYPTGSTSIRVNDLTKFPDAGSVTDAATLQTFLYTGRSGSSGGGTLTGIPASGTGSIASAILGGTTLTAFNAIGQTSLHLNDITQVYSVSGTVRVGSQLITYTAVSGSRITGIPASGTGSITSTIATNATVEFVFKAGDTSIRVNDCAKFLAAGGSALVGSQVVTYTARSAASGIGALTGVPASGTGAVVTTIVGGATITAVYPPGSTTLAVADTSPFAGAASARSGSQVFTYTGRSVASGAGNITGIPASGASAIASNILGGDTVTFGSGGNGTLTGIPASGTGAIRYSINQGDDVNLVAIVNDTAAQTALAALIGGDGVQEAYIQDRRISYNEAVSRGEALLALRGALEESVNAKVRDPLMTAGATMTVNLSEMGVDDTFKVQAVRIGGFTPANFPIFDADGASSRFSFEDLLRQARETKD